LVNRSDKQIEIEADQKENLAIFSYYLSYAAVDKYQKDLKEKLARQKVKLAGTKEKVKKKMEERKIHKAEVKSQMSDHR
jgi:hypothetical protein